MIEECSDLCISVVQARFYGGSGGVQRLMHVAASAWRAAVAALGRGGAGSSASKPEEEEEARQEFSSASQFAGDVVAHVMLSGLMMTLLLGVFSPGATLVVEWIVLLLFLGDEVPHPRAAISFVRGGGGSKVGGRWREGGR